MDETKRTEKHACDLISRRALIDAFCAQCTVDKPETCSTIRYGDKWCNEVYVIQHMPTVDAVPVVRCKDCKHRPTGVDRDDLEFPDDKCPCKCEDYWYSWKPADEWYCGNGERREVSDAQSTV